MGRIAVSGGPTRNYFESPCSDPACGNDDCHRGRARQYGDVDGTYADLSGYHAQPLAVPLLPDDPKERKGVPLASGVFDYFTSALIEVAKVSKAGNDQHNPGEPLHWARGKSMDTDDTMLRHFAERGTIDKDGLRHSAKLAWRALALLQLELEAAGAPVARGAK